MAEDIAPALIESIKKEFKRQMGADKELASKLKLIMNGSRSYTDSMDFADDVGKALAEAMRAGLTPGVLPDDTMYYNIAKRLIDDLCGEAFDLAADAAGQVQDNINSEAGLGLKSIAPGTKNERLTDLVNTVSGKPLDEALEPLLAAAGQLPLGAVSDTLKSNAEFQGKAGLKARIVRKAEFRCCKWCSSLSGTYSYPDVPDDVYKRHSNCRCKVEYIADKERQTIHAAGDEAQRRNQEEARQERLRRYSAMTAEQKKRYDAQAAYRAKHLSKVRK